jgi:hypothetical protein
MRKLPNQTVTDAGYWVLINGHRLGSSVQVSEKRELQNIEQGIMNVEGKENFIIRNSLFDIRYSNWGN